MGKPLILHQIHILTSFDEDVYLVTHTAEQAFQYEKKIDFPREVTFITDDPKYHEETRLNRPILGIYSGFKRLKEEGFLKAFLISCDMPLIKPEVIRLMIQESKGYDCCIPRWENGFLEPFFAIYPVEKGLHRARKLLTEGRGLTGLIDESWETNYVSVEDSIKPLDQNLVSLINISGPIDLVKATKLYKEG